MESPYSKVKEGKGGSGDWLGFESLQVHNERQYMNIDELLAEFPYGIVVLEGNDVLHICSYPSEPTMEDCLGLLEELKTDPEFGFIGHDFSNTNFCKAEGELLRTAIDVFSNSD